jgi:hypothetical protein
MADWLQANGFANSKRRFVTLSYLKLVFGESTKAELREACRYLAAHRDEPIKWLALARHAKSATVDVIPTPKAASG